MACAGLALVSLSGSLCLPIAPTTSSMVRAAAPLAAAGAVVSWTISPSAVNAASRNAVLAVNLSGCGVVAVVCATGTFEELPRVGDGLRPLGRVLLTLDPCNCETEDETPRGGRPAIAESLINR